MAILIATAGGVYFTISSFQRGLEFDFNTILQPYLIVEEQDGLGEIYGSRIKSSTGIMLEKMGLDPVIPEIHQIVGTKVENAVLLRGISLPYYRQVIPFTILEGRYLQPGDAPRQAMVGYRLAETKKIKIGESIMLRGRSFSVVGIFKIGTYEDNEAWISLIDAQDLLGFGEDVSLYIVPDNGILMEGQLLEGGLAVVRRGANVRFMGINQGGSLIRVFDLVARTMGIAAAVALMNILWRLAWMRRYQLAVLYTLGFGRPALIQYLLTQAAWIVSAGMLLSLLFTTIITRLFTSNLLRVNLVGLTIMPRLEWHTLLTAFIWGVIVTASSIILPAVWLSRRNLAELLHAE